MYGIEDSENRGDRADGADEAAELKGEEPEVRRTVQIKGEEDSRMEEIVTRNTLDM